MSSLENEKRNAKSDCHASKMSGKFVRPTTIDHFQIKICHNKQNNNMKPATRIDPFRKQRKNITYSHGRHLNLLEISSNN